MTVADVESRIAGIHERAVKRHPDLHKPGPDRRVFGQQCEGKCYTHPSNGKRGSRCRDEGWSELDGHVLCWVHMKAVTNGNASLLDVLTGTRPRQEP